MPQTSRRKFLVAGVGVVAGASVGYLTRDRWLPKAEFSGPPTPSATATPTRTKVNHPPTADFEIVYDPNRPYPTTGQTINFINKSTDPDGDELRYKWIRGRIESSDISTRIIEEEVLAETKNCSVKLSEGEYFIRLEVSDGNLEDAKEVSLTVVKDRPLPSPGIFFDEKHLNYVRENRNNEPYKGAWFRLENSANSSLSLKPKPIFGNWSVPDYYKDKQGRDRMVAPLEESANAVMSCAEAFMIIRDRKYATKVVEIADSWTGSLMNISSQQATFEARWNLQTMATALNIVENYGEWDKKKKESHIEWQVDRARSAGRVPPNNLSYWRAVHMMAVGRLSGDQYMMDGAVEVGKNAIEKDIAPDGHMPQETAREYRGIHYQNFALDALFFLAEMAYQQGIDLYSYKPNNRSLKLASDYFFRYYNEPEKWPWSKEKQDLSGIDWSLGWFEFAYYRWQDPTVAKWLKVKRPIRDMWAGGYTTLTHGLKLPG